MAAKAKQHSCEFRPHFKTHQSLEVGRWIRSEGVTGITVSSPSMALYFVEDGWDDITIAFPFYAGMLNDLKKIEKSARIRLFIHEPEHLALLDKELSNEFKFYIEIDGGYGRSGIDFSDRTKIDELIITSKKHSKSNFHGFYIHDGRTYKARSENEIEDQISPAFTALAKLKSNYPDAAISLGDTPSASVMDNLDTLDELTAGNFVFYDWMQVQIGSCNLNDVALFVLLPVAQSIKNGKQAIIHGGAVHLSKDTIQTEGKLSFGQAVIIKNTEVTNIKGAYLSALSQEHGTMQGFDLYPESDYVTICPVHSCLTANLFKEYHTFDGSVIEKRILS